MGVEGGKPPRQTLPGITRSVAPKGRLLSLKIEVYLCPVSFGRISVPRDFGLKPGARFTTFVKRDGTRGTDEKGGVDL